MLITGASQGIGRCLAVHFAPCAAELILVARSAAGLDETAAQVRSAGGHACALPADLRDPASIQRVADSIRQSGTRVDVLINNAADVTSKPLLGTSLDEIDSLIRTNVIGCLQLCRLIAPLMIEQGRGLIVNVSSLAGYKPNPTQTAYSVSKAAVNGLSDALRAELGPKGIQVMNVALASISIDQAPRPGQVPVAVFAQRLERAIERDETEVFLSVLTKWLMRLYRFFPALARLR
jgi:short-subunit dehydrogenase